MANKQTIRTTTFFVCACHMHCASILIRSLAAWDIARSLANTLKSSESPAFATAACDALSVLMMPSPPHSPRRRLCAPDSPLLDEDWNSTSWVSSCAQIRESTRSIGP